jgi:hypothetical protein
VARPLAGRDELADRFGGELHPAGSELRRGLAEIAHPRRLAHEAAHDGLKISPATIDALRQTLVGWHPLRVPLWLAAIAGIAFATIHLLIVIFR